ncbi:MAG TPA: 3-phosphoshikimate 1-carboxyvinyltransferase [Gemmatimonadaceae bacterium]
MTVGRVRLVVRGELRVPGDKSVSHRALMFGALADGTTRVRGILQSADIESTAGALRALGWAIPELAPEMTVEGLGLSHVPFPVSHLDLGNSGTSTRLLMGIVAGFPIQSTFSGDASLSRRPMRRVAVPLTEMGARIEFDGDRDGLPLTVHGGNLRALDWTLDTASAQVKSALLMAGITGRVAVVIREPAPTRDHTERMLRAQGAAIDVGGGIIVLDPPPSLEPLDITVPGDPSSAAFFACLAALSDAGSITIRDVGLNPGRCGFIAVLRRMGARVDIVSRNDAGAEPLGDIVVRPVHLSGTRIDGDEVPSLIDELPALACVAARAHGETVISGAAELRVKESDRIAAVVANLRNVGVDVEEAPDGMRIRGTREALTGTVQTHGDHRLAMAFGVLGSSAHSEFQIDDPDCVNVSYPDFWRDLANVTV